MNFNYNDQRRIVGRPGFGIGRPGFGFGPGLGFGRPGFGGIGFGLPFVTGLAAGALLTPRPYPYYPYQPYPYPPYPYY
ncbi:spore coat protein [Sutcliffiella horikoshii]|uniref:Spore coat protein n=1 Tax=Sutcliffiella horikoshii TaxID=79883 RepID=A0A5D4T1A9_9BACI|nr:spore coat protein [Sutcliffiella horikoshii]TYS69383.1 spore coat protein [Sutcliffiella horikoshii]